MKQLITLAVIFGSASVSATGMDSSKLGTLQELSTVVCKDYPTPSINERVKELRSSIEVDSTWFKNGKVYAHNEQKTFAQNGVPRQQFCELFESEVAQGNY
ncbi:exported hypothetical protein [Vibrio crassostreae]|nr:exported hypothetical protein [Vibrio crassostreae]CAK2335600.1 exported hypothetical protein [Vibrio crassostreae]CAK2504098.1 exported hypothetical protein [Vibrio crassostreae]CAK2908920.1 exported hypothetical protein [Vibrio crassostreae]